MMNLTFSVKNVNTLSTKQQDLIKAFQSAKSVDETLKTFKEMESCFDDSELGVHCLILAAMLVKQNRLEQVLCFGNRALRILLANINNNITCFGNYSSVFFTVVDENGTSMSCSVYHKSSLFIAFVCTVLGAACVDLNKYDESLGYLNWANMNLSKLEQDDDEICCGVNCVMNAVIGTQFQLYRAKFSTHRVEEAALHMRKVLEVKEKLLEEGCIELGEANMNVCYVYGAAMNLRDALPFCLKALKIKTKHLGCDSVEVAETRSFLGWIYNELGEYEKGIAQRELSESVVKEMTRDFPNSLIESGRYEEAIGVLKGFVSRDDMEEDQRASAFVSMATAFYELGNFADAEKCMRTAKGILEKEYLNQIYVAVLFAEMSRLYEKMNDSETALSLIRKVLTVPNLPQDLFLPAASRIFSLVSQYGKEEEEIPYMLNLVEKLIESFGPEHYGVGYGYAHLGAAYWNLGQQKLAVKFMANAKDIMDVTIGPHHVFSLKTSQILSTSYAKMGSYDLAIGIQEKVVEGFKCLGPSEHELFEEAVIYLDKIKEGVSESCASLPPQSQDDVEDLSETMSKCAISDDGKENKLFQMMGPICMLLLSDDRIKYFVAD